MLFCRLLFVSLPIRYDFVVKLNEYDNHGNMELRIKERYCYQVINNLLDVTTPSTARMLMKLASSKGAVEVSQDEALERGFEELANWSMPEYDRLFIIDDFILVCLPKNGGAYA